MSETKTTAILSDEDLPRFDRLLEYLSESEVLLLYEHLDEAAFSDGEMIFPQGHEGSSLYIIKSGRVTVVLERGDGTRKIITTLSEGHILGEIAFMMGTYHTASAEAEGNTELYILNRDDFDAILLEDPTLAFKILMGINKVLCYRLKRINSELAGMKEREA